VIVLSSALPAARCVRWRQALDGAGPRAQPMTALPLDADEVLQAVADGPAGPLLQAALGPAPWVNLDQSWLRHGRPPHGWHQDGALRHDFLAHAGRPAPADAALEMQTLWITLTPCGLHAPGLEWVTAEVSGLLSPEALTPQAVSARFPATALTHAEMAPGDALLFDGLCLHRTHLTAAMTQPRLSLELRAFRASAVPARVAGDAGRRLPPPCAISSA